jgi:hypothetical protein
MVMDGEVHQLKAVDLVLAKQYIVDTNNKRSHCRYKQQEVAFLPSSRSFFTLLPINDNTNPLVKTKNIGLAYWSIDGDRSSFKSIYRNVEHVV